MTEPNTRQRTLLDAWHLAEETLAEAYKPKTPGLPHLTPSPSDILRLALWLDGATPADLARTLGTDVQRSTNARG